MEIKLDILGLSFEDTSFLKHILEDSINEHIDICEFAYGINEEYTREVPVALITGRFLMEKAKSLYPNSIIIVANRIITGQNLEKVMLLPKNKKVMVVNYPEEVTMQTIESLKKLGLTHLNYIPFWPGINTDLIDLEIDTAISPGHIYLCPEFIKHKIDLGRRTIAFSSFIKLIEALGLDVNMVDKFAEYHINLVVNSGNKISKLLLETEKLSKNLSVVLSQIKNGIISIDENDCVVLFNPWAERIFKMSSAEVLGKHYKKVFKEYYEFIKLIEKNGEVQDMVIYLKSQPYLGSLAYIYEEHKSTRICTLNEVSAIQKMEQNVRRNLYDKGYIAKYDFSKIKGTNEAIVSTIEKAKKFARKDLTVLIHGESGTGKELFAQSIHRASNRSEGPFIAVNFAALHENIVESELFGYEEGSFTGAAKGGKPGLFEQAHKGTIFLDEIGDAPPKFQSKLLRVLQEHEVMRLGASKIIPIDVRVVAATNKDLKRQVEEGAFREDLYYRLKVLTIDVPPLRQRKEDIPVLIECLMEQKGLKMSFSNQVIRVLQKYDWPGNIRELENVISYICALKENDNDVANIEDLPPEIAAGSECNLRTFKEQQSSGLNEDEYCLLLSEIYAANQKEIAIGRKGLAEICQSKCINLSESNIRTRLKKLAAKGLISCGRTKQGIFITQKGIEYIKIK